MNHSILFAAMLVAAGAAQADGQFSFPDEQASPHRVYTYALELDGDGGISRLTPHGFAADAVSSKLESDIRGWVFEPSGKHARPATTYLRVVVEPDNANVASGDFTVVSALTGPAPSHLTQPDYPVQDQRAGKHGSVVLKLQVGTDGRVQSAEVADVAGDVSRRMANSARATALEWRFSPETVGGAPLASTILWPVCFLGATASAADCEWVGPQSQRFSSRTVLTLDSAARLVSPTDYPLAYEGR